MMQINLKHVKFVARTVTGMGAGRIAQDIIRHNTMAENKFQVVLYTAGSVAIGLAASDYIRKYTDEKIDEIAAEWSTAKAELESAQEEIRKAQK